MSLATQLNALEKAMAAIWDVALDLGLDPFPTQFEIVPATIMHELGAYGLPGRFSHWSHGKAFQRMKTAYDYGLARIYELVINTNPCHAFLLETNTLLENKLVCAHVLGHSDFFRHNAYFARVDRGIGERAHISAERIREHEFEHGRDEVEALLDAALALEAHVDPWLTEEEEDDQVLTEDLLLFLRKRSPILSDWQRDILAIVRRERLYFWPQIKTKIINEGWATFWHARILREIGLEDAEYLDFSRLHSSVLTGSPLQVNPYFLGYNLLAAIASEHGIEALFNVRNLEDDISFIRNYLTPQLIKELGLLRFGLQGDAWVVKDRDPEAVIAELIAGRINGGEPVIVVADADYNGNRELYLVHRFDGRQLRLAEAAKALGHVARLWGRRVHLETIVKGETKVLSCSPTGD